MKCFIGIISFFSLLSWSQERPSVPRPSEIKKLEQLVIAQAEDVDILGELAELISGVERNLYDEAIEILNSEHHPFIPYLGQDQSFRKFQKALQQEQRRHVILKGSRHSDKMGIMKIIQASFIGAHISVDSGVPPVMLKLGHVNTNSEESLNSFKRKLKKKQGNESRTSTKSHSPYGRIRHCSFYLRNS